MGREAREEAERQKALQQAGYQKKLEYIEEGKKNKKEKMVCLYICETPVKCVMSLSRETRSGY